MKEIITVCQVQADLIWEQIDANLDMLEAMLEHVRSDTDLIVLPETFSTGFTMQSDLHAEEEDGKALAWMKRMAREKQSFITGSVITRENNQIFNRLYWVSPSGVEGHYNKRHLFRMGREDQHFSPGQERPVFHLGDFRFLPQICYDLRFPVFSRNKGDYDVLLYVANWPVHRHRVWEILLQARAIENQSYVLGTSRSGTDGLGIGHAGGSCAIDPKGHVMDCLDEKPGLLTSNLNLEELRAFREKFPAWKDADRFRIE
ncbi:MAG: amidohydrolase [Bacteroidota bacterium]